MSGGTVRNIRTRRNGKTYLFQASIMKNNSMIEETRRDQIKNEIKELFTSNWKDLGSDFLDFVVDQAKWLLLLRHEDNLVGLAVVDKKQIAGKTVYIFRSNALIPQFRSYGLMGRMNHMLFNRILADNVVSNKKLTVEIMVTTPNPRVLGALASVASFIYPAPDTFDRQSKKVPLPDAETWQMAKEYKKDYPKDMSLSKEGCVLVYDLFDWPHCEYKKNGVPQYKEGIVNELCRTYLQDEKGVPKMFIVRARITLGGLIKYLLRLITGRV